MAQVRDFRSETLEHMRENLVDKNPDAWHDAMWDSFTEVFHFNKNLKADLSNFDTYMLRICEINDITAKNLDEIVANVHEVESSYTTRLYNHRDNAIQCYVMLYRMLDEISDEHFETAFDVDAFAGRLGEIKFIKTTDYSALPPAQLTARLAGMGDAELATLDIASFSESQRRLYFAQLYVRLANTASPVSRQLFCDALAAGMTHADRMAMVFNPNGQYGGDQGWGIKRENIDNPEYLNFLKESLGLRFNMNNLTDDEMKELLKELIADINNSGCGYTSVANAVMLAYADKPAAFEEKFGFAMYGPDGELNFHYLVAHVYLLNRNPDFDPKRPYSKEENRVTLGGGGSVSGRAQLLDWLQVEGLRSDGGSHSIKDELKEIDKMIKEQTITEKQAKAKVDALTAGYVEEVRKELEAGHAVTIRVCPVVLQPGNAGANSGWDNITSAGAHAMTVTDVDEKGNLIVSSWGNQYKIAASELTSYYRTRTIDDKDENGEPMDKTFEGYVEYEVYA